MGLWNYGRKGTHDREAGSSSGRRRGSVKEEAASPPRQAAAPFSIHPRPGAGHRDRQYLSVEVCRRYSETRMPVPWSDVHLPNAWHLSADRVLIPPVPMSSRARREEIERRRRLLPDDLYYDRRYDADSTLWDTWLKDEHDVHRASPRRSWGRGGHGSCAGAHEAGRAAYDDDRANDKAERTSPRPVPCQVERWVVAIANANATTPVPCTTTGAGATAWYVVSGGAGGGWLAGAGRGDPHRPQPASDHEKVYRRGPGGGDGADFTGER
ncbi:ADP-ribosylation factor-related protein 1 [Hordeum vulgare]|nr:ADP-ribosylation factor-related protein 1 [Hordeum vulgare]